ncbi:hypothetical protein COLO4_12131 [Corchorus olitorius]|uniref:DUF668 domain-containing protein n=1 Tax=Corchorus olitorius TaxID=93759 RepID=A0A1R3K246_9ROSI|nr:hypothetical protein COLO4_12131 [Corchorus olitorius]
MGGICSRSSGNDDNGVGNANGGHDLTHYKSKAATVENNVMAPPQVREAMEKGIQEPDDLYDGIPRYTLKSRSVRSTHAAVAKVSEVSLRLGTVGLGKAVEVLDTLGSSMTSLNPNSGFAAGVPTKGNELGILAFEVANTIVKDGVQNLISKDMDELLRIVEMDKREELKIFSGEVVRFGNRSKDPQWHNLERYFEKISRDLTPQNQLKDEVESVIEQLMTSVQYTAVLDKFEQDYLRKRQEEDNSSALKADSLAYLRAELKGQRKQVMEKLVDIVHYLILEIHYAFGSSEYQISAKGSVSNHQRLGPAGLALHYANIIMQIDTLASRSACLLLNNDKKVWMGEVARSSSIPANTRDALYQSLPPSVKLPLRAKLQSFHIKEELTVTQIKDEMEKTLHWLVPVATNTAKKPANGPADIMRIETLHHADKEKTEAYILEQLLWLHHLVNRSKSGVPVGSKTSIKTLTPPPQEMNEQPKNGSTNAITPEEQKLLQDLTKKVRIPGISRSQDFDSERRLKKHDRLSKSTSHSPPRESKEKAFAKRLSSGVPIIGFSMYKEKVLDAIDRVDSLR